MVAVVTAGILLIIAMSIGGIALKEQVLSTANKESQVAFYAADTGMECALYADQIKGAFAPDVDSSGNFIKQNKTASIDCNGGNVEGSPISPNSSDSNINKYSYTFKISNLPIGDSGVTTCAVVNVDKDTKYFDEGSSVSRIRTEIHSYGYSTCDPSINRLERGVEGHY